MHLNFRALLERLFLLRKRRARRDYVETMVSALGHKRTLRVVRLMSALAQKADTVPHDRDIRLVLLADLNIAAP
jgi:hypothetical protein